MLGVLHEKLNNIIEITRISENGVGSFYIDYKNNHPTPEQQSQIDVLVAAWPVDSKWCEMRAQRDGLLKRCDWRVLVDAPGVTSEWLVYRQSLRDLPAAFETASDVVWPVEPE